MQINSALGSFYDSVISIHSEKKNPIASFFIFLVSHAYFIFSKYKILSLIGKKCFAECRDKTLVGKSRGICPDDRQTVFVLSQ